MKKKEPQKTIAELLKQIDNQIFHIKKDHTGTMKLRQWLRLCYVSNQDFARLLGVQRATIQFYLNGIRKPSEETMDKIRDLTSGFVDQKEDLVDG